MTWLIYTITTLLVILVLAFQLIRPQPAPQVKAQTSVKSPFELLNKKMYFPPVRVFTAEKTIDVSLARVDVGADGALQTPLQWDTGGWFVKSAKAGENGNTIINAHYDTNNGAPAAFWELKNLKEGDKVFLLDEMGRFFDYKVARVFYIDINDPNRLDILEDGDKNGAVLTLITCGGVWDAVAGNYSKRVVVQASRI